MKKVWWLIGLGIVTFAVFATVTLPANVIAGPLGKQGIVVSGISGTVWHGAAQVVQSGNVNIGSLQWTLRALPLLTGRAVADVKLDRIDGYAQGNVSIKSSGELLLHDVDASLPVSTLPPNLIAGGWTGKLTLKLSTVEIIARWPTQLVGSIEVLDLAGPARRPTAMGSYKLVFPEQPPSAVLRAALTDISGPLQLAGTLELKASDRSYVLEGLIAARSEASSELSNSLQFLGPADAQGRRPISLAGTM
jgi:general secretion pathway protein N